MILRCPVCNGKGSIDQEYTNVVCPECGYSMVWNDNSHRYDCPQCGAAWARIRFGRFAK